jgi:hypothetical protein
MATQITSGSTNRASIFVLGKFVHTVYTTIPLEYALDWPAVAPFVELAAFAKLLGGRIPALEEARSIYSYVDATRKEVAIKPSSLISAVNGFVNEILVRREN